MKDLFELSLGREYSKSIVSGTYDGCIQEACRLHDEGEDDNFFLKSSGQTMLIRSHTLEKVECLVCGKETRVYNLLMTHDCHGIPYRKVCPACYDRIMNDRGFDGEEYSEIDENLDYDY